MQTRTSIWLSDTSILAAVPSGSWSYNQDDQLSGETYDQDGNVTASGGKTFSYDSQNEMLSMNGGAVQMVYDGDGNRVVKSVNGVVTRYLVDDLNPTGLPQVMDELTNGVVTRTYTYGLQRISEDQIVNGAWTPSFYSYDGMGNVRQLTDINGTVTDSYEYDAFGSQITHTGTTPNNYLYRGEQFDPDLGLYYLRARYYNPITDRFMSRDPLDGYVTGVVGLNKYLYASADPVNRLDPSGRSDTTEVAEEDAIDLSAAGRRAPTKVIAGVAVAGGTGLYALSATISCHFFTDAAAINAVRQNLGFVQTLLFYASGCTAFSIVPRNDVGPPVPVPQRRPPSPCGPGQQYHHLLPWKYREWFAKCGIDVNLPQYMRCVPTECHTGTGGLHPEWNEIWSQFNGNGTAACPGKQAIINFMNQLEQEYWQYFDCIGGAGLSQKDGEQLLPNHVAKLGDASCGE